MEESKIVDAFKSFNVLVIEQDSLEVVRIENIFNDIGIHKRSFFNSTEMALNSILSGTKYDLIIIDWKIKNKPSAKSFCQRVQKLGASMPIVFISSNNLLDYFDAFEAGATNIVSRPANKEDLFNVIWSALNIENFRSSYRVSDLNSLKNRIFFQLTEHCA